MTKKQHTEPQDKQYVSPEQWKLINFPSSYKESSAFADCDDYPFETLDEPKSTHELISSLIK